MKRLAERQDGFGDHDPPGRVSGAIALAGRVGAFSSIVGISCPCTWASSSPARASCGSGRGCRAGICARSSDISCFLIVSIGVPGNSRTALIAFSALCCAVKQASFVERVLGEVTRHLEITFGLIDPRLAHRSSARRSAHVSNTRPLKRDHSRPRSLSRTAIGLPCGSFVVSTKPPASIVPIK